MLPDLPSLKADIERILDGHLADAVQARLGVFNQAPRHPMHEGDRLRVVRADGTVEDSALASASSEFSIRFDEVSTLSPQDRAQRLAKVADEMASQISSNLFRGLNETLEKAGQVIDGAGRPLTPEIILEVLETLQLSFGPDSDEPQNLSIVLPPNLYAKGVAAFETIRMDPALRARYRELMLRKREEWRDREASRKLVG